MAVFEYDFFIRFSIVLYLVITITQIIRHTYTVKQLFIFVLSYISGLLIIYELFFPLEIEGFSYIRARLLAMQFDNPLPFSGFINALQQTNSQGKYLLGSEYPPGTWTTPYTNMMHIIRFSVFHYFCATILIYSRLWTDTSRKTRSTVLRSVFVFLGIADILYIIKYYFLGLNKGAYDTSFILFQTLGVSTGYLIFHIVGWIRRNVGRRERTDESA